MKVPQFNKGVKTMKEFDVYLYGMILMTTSHLLRDDFPESDSYSEITKTYFFPGGETATCGTVLSSLGASVVMDGNHMGVTTFDPIVKFYQNTRVDTSRLTHNPSYQGLQDIVFIDKNTRTCFGRFIQFYDDPEHGKWNKPCEEDIKNAKVVGLDPFFFKEADLVAEYCRKYNKKYVTIDCKYDSLIHELSEVNVISNEFIKGTYSDRNIEDLFKSYTDNTNGLVIFTFGARDILYGRKGEPIKRFSPYKVDVVSTLGAGDSFKAGAVYALLNGMSDADIVSFASATAAVAVTSFPLPANPPTLEKINSLRNSRT